jgi:hypothetical protein
VLPYHIFFIKFKQIKNGFSSAIISTLTQLPLTVPANKQFDLTIVSENLFYVVYINDEIAFTNRIYKKESKSMDNFLQIMERLLFQISQFLINQK